MKRRWILLSILIVCWRAQAELSVPAFTAYTLPDPEGAQISARRGLTRWTDPGLSVNWYGQFSRTGEVSAKVILRLPKNATSKLKLTLADQSREIQATGAGGEDLVTMDFGKFQIAGPGYQRFTLNSLNKEGQPAGDLESLTLDGPAVMDAHFNLKERRNAASVHLSYPLPEQTKITAFYCEMTAVEDPLWTYYMACGWHRGYFGMQVNSPTERRIIFSVWDSGKEGQDRNKVEASDRVTLVAKGENVEAGDFGNEGTGGHSHWVHSWKTGERQRFIVTAKPVDTTHTIYSGYYFQPEKQEWRLISSWKAPKDGGYLRGLYSFSENFGGANGNLHRKALYGNQWFKTSDGKWIECTTAGFSHDPTGKADRLDRFMGVEDGQFFLSQGGFVDGFTRYGEKFSRPANGTPPAGIKLPLLPE
jgi:hypothetical protein